jgi:tetratricopeptide (TPR) repeat protein
MAANAPMARRRRRWAALALAGALLTVARPRAQAHDDAPTLALRLQFAQGLALEGAGRWADALPRFEEVARLRPTANVKFHIALCHNRLGRLLQAERSYHVARDAARATAPEVIPEINAHLQDLDGRMPRVMLVVAGARDGVTLQLDGAQVEPSKLLRVDPGPHVALATHHGVPVAASAFSIVERRTKIVTLMIYPLASGHARR